MKTIIAGVILLCIGVACAERTFPHRSLAARAASAGGNQQVWYLGAPRKAANSVQAVQVPLSGGDLADDGEDDEDNYQQQGQFSVVQDDDDGEDEDHNNEDNFENDDDDEDSESTGNVVGVISFDDEGNTVFSNRQNDNAIIEFEDRDIDNDDDDDDEESGQTAIYLPRAALENIPNGSILALVDDSDDESTGRAVKRYYRRRRKSGPKRKRRGNKRGRRRRRGNKRRRRPSIRVINPGRRGNRNRGANQRRRPNVIRL